MKSLQTTFTLRFMHKIHMLKIEFNPNLNRDNRQKKSKKKQNIKRQVCTRNQHHIMAVYYLLFYSSFLFFFVSFRFVSFCFVLFCSACAVISIESKFTETKVIQIKNFKSLNESTEDLAARLIKEYNVPEKYY